MEGNYQTFYSDNNIKNDYIHDTFDIDDIINGYMTERQFDMEADKKDDIDCLSTTFSTKEEKAVEESRCEENLVRDLGSDVGSEREEAGRSGCLDRGQSDLGGGKADYPETLNLTKYFHEEILKHMKQMYKCKVVDREDWELVICFEKQQKNLKSHRQLFKSLKIREICLQYFQSSEFTKNLLSSKKMQFQRKINILKYTARMCQLIKEQSMVQNISGKSKQTQIKSWKR